MKITVSSSSVLVERLICRGLSDEELAAICWALDGLVRSNAGDMLYEEVLIQRSHRQAQQAREENWHISHEPPNPPDWNQS